MNEVFRTLEDESKQRFPTAINFMKIIEVNCLNRESFSFPKSITKNFPKLKRENPLQCQRFCFVIHHYSEDVCYSSVKYCPYLIQDSIRLDNIETIQRPIIFFHFIGALCRKEHGDHFN